MDIQQPDTQLTETERKLYLLGAIVFAGLLLSTVIFGSVVSPLRLLILRLSILGTGLIYYLAIYFYNVKYLLVTPQKDGHVLIAENQYDIIICINGKELGRW